jgi:hypothetical protein
VKKLDKILLMSYIIIIIRARNGFDGLGSKGECMQGRYALNSSNFINANNNLYFEEALAA